MILDGDVEKVDVFARAYEGIGKPSPPSLTNCYQSELYYPHMSLADLAAGYLADRITTGALDYADPLVRIPSADHHCSERWGRTFSHLQRGEPADYERLSVDVARGDSERERASMWYAGMMGRSPTDPATSPSLGTVVRYLRGEGVRSPR